MAGLSTEAYAKKKLFKSKSGQQKFYLIMLLLIIGVFVALAIYYQYQNNLQTKQAPAKINLKNFALLPGDVSGYRILSESSQLPPRTNAISAYIVSFVQYGNTGSNPVNPQNYKTLSNSILLYKSLDDLKKEFNKENLARQFPSTFKEASIATLGDESFAFSGSLYGVNATYVWFRKGNYMGGIQLTNENIGEAIGYARIVTSKIK